MTSIEIIKELRKIGEMQDAVNEETGEFIYSEEDIAKAYEAINAEKEVKLNAIEDYKRSVKKEQELYEEKKKKQEANIKRCKAKTEYLKGLQEALLNGEKLKTDEYTFSYRKSTSVKVIDEAELASQNYVSFEPKIDKKAIQEAFKNGVSVKGAELEEKMSLSIR